MPPQEEVQNPMPAKEGLRTPEAGVPTSSQQLPEDSEAYVNALMKMLHDKQMSPQVVKMLSAGEPQDTIPKTALMLHDMLEKKVRERGKPPSLDTLFVAGTYLVSDLIEIGNAAGVFDLQTEEETQPIVQSVFQKYIQKGLKDGTIDPVELQTKVEGLLSPEDKVGGLQIAKQVGLPPEPDQHTAMEVYANKRVKQAGMLKGGK
jgi:hypothetical protein